MTLTNALAQAQAIAVKYGDDAVLFRAERGYEARERLPFDRLSDPEVVAFVTPDNRLIFDHGDAS